MKQDIIKLNVSNNSISEYKVFEGMKLYSEMFKSEDGKKLTNKRVFVTKKQNYVYYERTDVNWNYWSDKRKYDNSFDISEIKSDIKFEVSSKLEDFTKYLGDEIIKKIKLKEKNEEIIEVLDI
ncbi:MAG: EXLDI protein [Peptoniphilus sp.]|uniref:EXLDI protein n=1 Tax=Peptoniphilus sp. TaxID=1971214 RepID=UPI0025E640DA|nr:EXLDI protein [Peptoniphilus sp.]MCI5642901.1 EXLDI protein [Peptoniphilus sp.]MDD7353363.1 EXLDI protein [Peptoniphilaceae bacterium]MDY3903365.1 EXLDI protein [Peptoniphilus sp.]